MQTVYCSAVLGTVTTISLQPLQICDTSSFAIISIPVHIYS